MTPADVVRVAKKYLNHSNKTTAVLIPTKKSQRASAAKSRGGS